jgi:hypothetical protein
MLNGPGSLRSLIDNRGVATDSVPAHPGRLYYCPVARQHHAGNVFYVADGGTVVCPGCGAHECAHGRHLGTYGACYDGAQLWANLANASPAGLLDRGACRLMPESVGIPGWIITSNADGEQCATPEPTGAYTTADYRALGQRQQAAIDARH